MAVPVIKQASATVSATNTWYTAVDSDTGLTFIRITKPNAILDIVNATDLSASSNQYTIALFKNGIDTGRRFYSTSMNPSSAGRIAVGPIGLGAGDYQLRVMQTAGTAASYACLIKFADAP